MSNTLQDSHGGDVVRLARKLGARKEELLDFSSNADTTVASLTAGIVAATPYPFDHYPDDDCTAVRQRIAAFEGVQLEQVLALNGSAEGIHLAVAAMRPRRVLLAGGMFSEYARACQGFNIPYEIYPLSEASDFEASAEDVAAMAAVDADMVVVCSPNNPTGAAFEPLVELSRRLTGRTLLLDATYREFMFPDPARETHRLPALQGGADVLLLSSFTKYFHCPGMRLGYAVAESKMLEKMRAVRAPWMVTGFAEQVGAAMLDRLEDYRQVRKELPRRRLAMRKALMVTGIFAWACNPAANFITLRMKSAPPAKLAQFLLERRIIIRDCDNIPGMPQGYVRIQVKTDEENAVLLEALKVFDG